MPQSRRIEWIAAEIGEGAQETGCKKGPAVLRKRSIETGRSVPTDWSVVISQPQPAPQAHSSEREESRTEGASKLAVVTHFMPHLAHTLETVLARGSFPLVIGGDHSCAIGTWSAVAQAMRGRGEIGLIWIDAHLDSHTPDTSDSQAPHGMPLAALLGYGAAGLTHVYGWGAKLQPANVVVIGARSYEPDENELLNRLGVRVMAIEEVMSRGMAQCMAEAIAIVSRNTVGYGVTFDVDGLDPLDAPGVGSPVDNGIRLIAAVEALAQLAHDPRLLAFELVEYNPDLDDAAHTTATVCEALLDAVLPMSPAHSAQTRAPIELSSEFSAVI
jgi:arginase